MKIIKVTDLNLKDKKVLIRSDLNVPIKNGKIMCNMRIIKSLETINFVIKNEAKCVIVASHLGNPIEEKYDYNFSLTHIVNHMKKIIKYPIRLIQNYLNGFEAKEKEIIVLENVRFNPGERKNDKNLSKKYANLCDILVMDSFGSSHRSESSTTGIIKFAPISCIGLLFLKEIKYLKKALFNSKRPIVTIFGGSKISTKLGVIEKLSNISENVLVGGGIANTILFSKGHNIGKSLHDKNNISKIKKFLYKKNIIIPKDFIVTDNINKFSSYKEKSIKEIKNEDYIVDIGKKSCECFIKIIKKAKTIFWNGPLGLIEIKQFRNGTKEIANSVIHSSAKSIIGGGETVLAMRMFNFIDRFSYISTGGGAFLSFIEKQELPVLSELKKFKKYTNFKQN
ncbi:pgk [Wigglesworthia glossinidia endosymbiont of Glossina brevipalpis]|uniref:Phosphoglycerate kinase n=1 Tax=Wigglesworthia glossinidia brevipalpis TaxID=36870 RepID=PGK_WIGBR|nr:RecName: Full=Phosphoglycerate kinase [Wigglesworthia glossinidia endosymbiont of Glossina brevipalpis]BAC24451.1 pgk [Wigglesworthia glossinidia endosymbiont of Glossina brevipalpis]